jgi:hypothetical protein
MMDVGGLSIMRARFTVCFRARDYEGTLGEAVLECELPFAPNPEIAFEHPVWDEARKPALVIYELEDKSFLVSFGIEELDTRAEWESEAELYRKHGWTVRNQLGQS